MLEKGSLPVPLHLRNAPTPLMKSLGYGGGYQYPHDFEGHFVAEAYLPEELEGASFYRPGTEGREKDLSTRLEALRQARAKGRKGEPGDEG